MSSAAIAKRTDVSAFLAARAERIRELSKHMAENTMGLGQELKAARDTFPVNKQQHRPGWVEWLKAEIGLSESHAKKLIRISEKLATRAMGAAIGVNVLEYLAREQTPEVVVNEVIARAKKGEQVGMVKLREIAKPHLPTRSEAIRLAQETGKLVAAKDGNLYSGASEDEMAAYSQRRSAVYGVRRAVKDIAEVGYSPSEWVKMAEAHWLAEFSVGELEAAIKWLSKMLPVLEKRKGIIDGD